MKAISRCPQCGKDLQTDCRTCIEAGINYHKCQGGFKIVKVDWKAVPASYDFNN